MIKKAFQLLTVALVVVSCKEKTTEIPDTKEEVTIELSDKNATPETLNLYKNLFRLREKGFLFGHQDDLAYGVNWKYVEGRSDVKDVTGDYPGLYGWDIGGLEKKQEKNLDGVPFDKMKEFIKNVYDRGGVNTISWHFDNPLTGKDAWDTTPNSLASVLPGGEKHAKFNSWLDEAASFFLSLKGSDGKQIPVIFRPFHELSATWFWWCQNNASPEEFTTLWKHTIKYLQEKGVHNVIYDYNTSIVKTKEDYLKYYPGTEYADILSFDNYQMDDPEKSNTFEKDTHNLLKILEKIAAEQNKLFAFSETGYEQIPYAKWWTGALTNAIGVTKISFVLAWRNHGWNEWMKPPKMHYYVPHKGHPNEQDFVDFYKMDRTLFQSEATKENLYK